MSLLAISCCLALLAGQTLGVGYHEDVGVPEATRIRLKAAQLASERISGGAPSEYGDNPYLAGILITLRSGQLSVCSGTLVTTKKVLTAAQCWYDGYNVGRKAEVKLGLVELFNAFRWDVWRVRMHPAYDPTSLLNDLAIMILDGNTWPNNKMMIPAFLPDVNETNTYAGMEARVSGYGKTSDYDQINPETNQQALTVTVMRPWECYWNMARRPADSSKIMCTPGSVLWGTCGADLGGPLVIPNFNGTGNHLLIGVTSIQSPFGCTSTFATGYTRVTEYVSWIKQNL
ncbi:serine protease SP24D-like [Spodoptera litura]|uniref:Serine protease SP24D-like n=1 Tax=Spodoptera litura TaxID=69820 RepID=A0A9J7J1X9_SPOLT|nr:serine protease SP24D-like [Spodoptera litura]